MISDRKRMGARSAVILARSLLLLTVLGLVACVTPGDGYRGTGAPGTTYPGGGYGQANQRLLATVQEVDPNYGRLLVSADSRDAHGGQSRVEVFFDARTELYYRGQRQAIAGLERGDRISIDVVRSTGPLLARRIEVVQDVREGYGGSDYGGELRGAVDSVDIRSRSIMITRGGYSGRPERVYYDANTRVEYQGRVYRPEQLQRGDVIRIEARPAGRDWLASRIWVEVDARTR